MLITLIVITLSGLDGITYEDERFGELLCRKKFLVKRLSEDGNVGPRILLMFGHIEVLNHFFLVSSKLLLKDNVISNHNIQRHFEKNLKIIFLFFKNKVLFDRVFTHSHMKGI